MRSYLIIGILALTSSTFSFGSSAASTYPDDLLYQGQPINSLCFFQEENISHTLNLVEGCGTQDIDVISANEEMLKKGYIGYEYRQKDNNGNDFSTTSYSYYKVIGEYENDYIISTVNNGGGSGTFTSVLLVRRENDKLRIHALPLGGDRCNGGINSVKQNDNFVITEVNITAGDLLALTKNNPHRLQPYHDLDACAACCIGTATYQTNLASNDDTTLNTVSFNKEADTTTNDGKKPYQDCFNRLLNMSVKNGQRTFTPEELNTFMDQFNASCHGKEMAKSE